MSELGEGAGVDLGEELLFFGGCDEVPEVEERAGGWGGQDVGGEGEGGVWCMGLVCGSVDVVEVARVMWTGGGCVVAGVHGGCGGRGNVGTFAAS